MDFGLDIQNKFKRNWLLLASGFIAVYFCFHIFCGERNIYRYFVLKQEIAQAQEIAKQYASVKASLQRDVDYLSKDSLDVDMLEERARAVLNMAAGDEFIILDNDI
ncbi:MAG: septum formation initiator family protein [Alphaproteobacteria bacterium]|nr:septum formation initiator family protein [Alphaproteobacteria bacterium]